MVQSVISPRNLPPHNVPLPVQGGGGELRQQTQRHIGPRPGYGTSSFEAAVQGPGKHSNKYSKRMALTWFSHERWCSELVVSHV